MLKVKWSRDDSCALIGALLDEDERDVVGVKNYALCRRTLTRATLLP